MPENKEEIFTNEEAQILSEAISLLMANSVRDRDLVRRIMVLEAKLQSIIVKHNEDAITPD